MTEKVVNESGWEKWHDWMARCMRPVTDWFCGVAEEGQSVLDTACGTGLPALAVAARVAPGGKVLATDPSEVMRAAVRRKAAADALTNLEVRAMAMPDLEVPEASFDLVTCMLGLMFCEPVEGAGSLRRALKEGGRFAVVCWDEPSANPHVSTLFSTLPRLLGKQPPDPDGPGPFRLSAPGKLEGVLGDAGFSDFAIDRVEVTFDFESLDQYWEIICDLTGPAAEAAATLGGDDLQALRAGIAEALAPYTVEGRVRIGGALRCASGLR